MTELLSLNFEEIAALMKQMGQPAFRAKQLQPWLNRGASFDEMLNLPGALRDRLKRECTANSVSVETVIGSKLDGTEKFLFRLPDGNLIEGVLMRYHHGATLCLSTQVGCKMGCVFCASTLDGCVRNLTPGEMLGQILLANAHLAGSNEYARVSRQANLEACESGIRAPEHRASEAPHGAVHNVVLMGSGEPLDNYDNVVKFLRLATDERGLNLSARGISLSTCGLVPQMRRLADEGIPVTLCLSLHAPNDLIRRKLMPIANTYPLHETIEACRHYIEKTGRRVIFEYALVAGVNDALEQADELSGLLRAMQCHVNLIPLNEVRERNLRPPERKVVDAFLTRLSRRHISATIRREMGDDIQGACGQLRRSTLSNRER